MAYFEKHCLFLAVMALRCLPILCCPDICSCSSGKVDCYSKGFYFIPEDITEDTHTLLLAYNNICVLKILSFLKYQQLEYLELQNNVISDIHSQAFQTLQNLSYLDLSNNQLIHIKPGVFKPLSSLITLNLGNNRIASLSGNALEPSTKLQRLFLYNNALTNLRTELLYNLPSLTHLRLDGNPWVCTCQIQYLFSWMIDNAQKIKEKERTLCDVPKYLEQFPVMEIQQNSFNNCQDLFTLFEYLYFLLIGISLFVVSIFLCLVTGSLIVCYDRVLLKINKRPRVYKKKTGKKREKVVNGNHIPVCNI